MAEPIIIGEHRFGCVKLNATKQMLLKARLIKYAGKSMGVIMAGAGKSQLIQIETITSAISEMFTRFPEEEIVDFIQKVTCYASRDGEKMNPIRFDEYFSDNLMDAYKVFYFVLEAQFAGFFALLPKAELKTDQLEDTPN